MGRKLGTVGSFTLKRLREYSVFKRRNGTRASKERLFERGIFLGKNFKWDRAEKYAKIQENKTHEEGFIHHISGLKMILVSSNKVKVGRPLIELNPLKLEELHNMETVLKKVEELRLKGDIGEVFQYLSNVAVASNFLELSASLIRIGSLYKKTGKEYTMNEIKSLAFGTQQKSTNEWLSEIEDNVSCLEKILIRASSKVKEENVKEENGNTKESGEGKENGSNGSTKESGKGKENGSNGSTKECVNGGKGKEKGSNGSTKECVNGGKGKENGSNGSPKESVNGGKNEEKEEDEEENEDEDGVFLKLVKWIFDLFQ